MNDEMKALAQRAVACEHWRWMPGMAVSGGVFSPWAQGIVGHVEDNTACVMTSKRDDAGWPSDYMVSLNGIVVDGAQQWNMLPDLTAPATLGCLLHLVREAWRGSPRWLSIPWDGEAETLVAALEAAP